MTTLISAQSTQYVYAEVTVTLPNGTPVNPTIDVVNFAFLPQSQSSPTATTTWVAGGWAVGTPYTAQCLVGPDGVIQLAPSPTPYTVWIQIMDNPEEPVLFAGRLGVT